ncbi:hypothetical protein EVAR_84166_1 [Eumeta japonica]|uniref:Secreted protein n=1 Tax=Eumeta variegata TaxID=151549 RepID=A0A4C2AC37_EUMVA|nr:hypothetical protein EVAR_84166_1 [Eumeta japonica]
MSRFTVFKSPFVFILFIVCHIRAVHFIAPSRDPPANSKMFFYLFRRREPENHASRLRRRFASVLHASPEDWAFFENVQYILTLSGRAVRRILQLKPVQVLSESAVSR